MTTWIEEAFNGRLMGNFDVPVVGRQASPPVYKDVGCAEVERRPYYYYGKCIDCPLPKCLEDGVVDKPPGRPLGVLDLSPKEAIGVVAKRRELIIEYIRAVRSINVKVTAEHFGVHPETIRRLLRTRRH